jgi:hypothetical protein
VAVSRQRNGWDTTALAYLDNILFREQVLGDEMCAYCRKVLEEGSDLEGQVLGWALEHMIPLRLLPQRPDWTLVRYEERLTRPENTLGHLPSGSISATSTACSSGLKCRHGHLGFLGLTPESGSLPATSKRRSAVGANRCRPPHRAI